MAMGEIQEHRYICKICSKICVSGKSLGGHMRIHLAQIAASKKAAKAIKIDEEDDNDDDRFNSAFPSEEKIKDRDRDSNTDVDQNPNYQLRENPKKSWRFNSDSKHGLTKKLCSCVECGKGFPSLRALSGHMRCHSIKNKEEHYCEKCGRGFNSIRAVFGHMKSHSKKSRMRSNEDTDTLSDLDNLCPVRRKRSRIGYKSVSNESDSGVFELGQVEEAATCLMMLSRGVRGFVKCETESSADDGYGYLGGESSCRSEKVSGNLVCYLKSFTEKCESEFDDQKNVGTEVSDDDILSDENETKVDFDDLRTSGSTKSAGFESNYGKIASCSVYESGSNLYGNEVNVESTSEGGVSLESSRNKEYECLVCFKVFSSGQALGGHKRAHFNGLIESKKKESMSMIVDQEVAEIHDAFDLNFPAAVEEGIKNDVGFHPLRTDRSHEAETLVFTN